MPSAAMPSTLQPRTLSETEKLAAQMLTKPNAVATLTLAEAMVIVDMMRPKRIPAGTIFITEGEDKLATELEFKEDGSIFANGQQIQ